MPIVREGCLPPKLDRVRTSGDSRSGGQRWQRKCTRPREMTVCPTSHYKLAGGGIQVRVPIPSRAHARTGATSSRIIQARKSEKEGETGSEKELDGDTTNVLEAIVRELSLLPGPSFELWTPSSAELIRRLISIPASSLGVPPGPKTFNLVHCQWLTAHAVLPATTGEY
ncbi:hypothetical protein GGX14DRAFT_402088 [Mycena pura]|uniref:Uncharacterized protein n=1 Tax=Mycena pura TaxID=153505 RepID=A0AAD6V333_9AGAR|nr:hypothetical protein GGX14DRAFT_402088 [Mycena pura]